jgi:hypothetical protein
MYFLKSSKKYNCELKSQYLHILYVSIIKIIGVDINMEDLKLIFNVIEE